MFRNVKVYNMSADFLVDLDISSEVRLKFDQGDWNKWLFNIYIVYILHY